MAVRRDAWTYVSGLVAVAETRLLADEALSDLAQRVTAAAGRPAVGAAQAGGGADRLAADLRQVETYHGLAEAAGGAWRAGLEAVFVARIRALASDCPDPAAAEVFLLQYDYARLREQAKAQVAGRGAAVPGVAPGANQPGSRPVTGSSGNRHAQWTEDDLRRGWERTFDSLPEIAEAVGEVSAALAGGEEAARIVDLVLDRRELEAFAERASVLGSDLINAWTRQYVLLRAALALVRASADRDRPDEPMTTSARGAAVRRHLLAGPLADEWLFELLHLPARERLQALAERVGAGLPVGATAQAGGDERSSSVERLAVLVDDRLTEEMRPARYVAFGPERVFGYAWGLMIENVNLRLIAQAAEVGLSAEALKARLRRSYG